MLGGGTFIAQNKLLPGSYINFVSAARASATLSDRGVVALPIALNWGKEGEVFTITQEDFQKNSLKILGYDYTATEIMPFREIFLNAVKVHVYNLNSGGVKATSDLATAKYAGIRGNDLKYVVSANIEDETKFDVVVYMGTSKVDSQTVASASELVDNEFVVYNKEAELTATAGTPLTGGTNGDVVSSIVIKESDQEISVIRNSSSDVELDGVKYYAWVFEGVTGEIALCTTSENPKVGDTLFAGTINDGVITNVEDASGTMSIVLVKGGVTGASYQEALDRLESYNFNVLACPSKEAEIIALFVAFTKRMRDQVGVKFQTVVYQNNADYEGVISLENAVEGDDEIALIYWVAGAEAGCAVNKSITNTSYNGELKVVCKHTQSELEAGILGGKLMFHKVEDEVRVLTDINTFVSVTDEKSEDFSSNQVIRVLDQCANDTASIFNTKYLGKVPNDASGRASFWNEIVTHRKQLQTIRAIENYDTDSLIVEQGDSKKSVVVTEVIVPTVAMEKLYMTIVVE